MGIIYVLGVTMAVLYGAGYYADGLYRRRLYQGQIKALFDVITSMLALAILLSVFIYLCVTIVYL